MNTAKIFITLGAIFTIFYSDAQTVKPDKIIVIDGYFFNEIPVSKQNISRMHLLKTPSGTMALGLEVNTSLSEEATKHAVPQKAIPEAEWLLQRYNEVKGASNGIHIATKRETALNVGDRFPEFTATDIDGRRWTNADVQRKVMVINLWFSGCAPCRAEMPELSIWKNEMPDVIFFSSTYENAEIARPIIEKQQFNWIHLVNNTSFKEFIGNNGYPMTIIVDKAGIISMIEYGTSPTQRIELRKRIEKLRE